MNATGAKISTGDAAKESGIHRTTLTRAAARGAVPPGVCFRLLGQYVWDLEALRAWIDASDVSQADCPTSPRRGRPSVLESVVRR